MSESRLRPGAAARIAAAAGSTWLLGTLVGLCSWSTRAAMPGADIDSSWMLGLQMALERGFHFGPDVIFTYGPLGFLQAPLAVFSPYAQISAIYALAVRVALGLTLLWSSRRAFGLWLGLPISLLAALLLPLAPILAIALIWCLVALGPDSPERVRQLFPYLAGPVAAIETLDKLSIGPVILLIGAITVLAMDGRRLRNARAFAGTFVVALVALWLSLGQGVADIGQYLRSGYEIVSGYSTAMVAAGENDESAHIVAFAGMTAVALAAGYVATRRLPPIRRVAVALVLALASFAAWKMAFVRFGLPTVPYLFTAAIPAWLAFPWRRLGLPGALERVNGVALGLAGFVVVAVLYFPLTQESLSALDPSQRLSRANDRLSELLSPGRRARTREESRALLTASFPLDRRTLALLKGHTVDIDQADIAVAWAYGLDWLPLPTFQAYAAYTPYLDRQNREALLAADGPSRILRLSSVTPSAMLKTSPAEVQSLNFLSDANAGLRAWNQPETTLAMLCNFKPLRTTRAAQVLERSANRCGAPRHLKTVSAGYGEEVPVPAPPGKRTLVYADVDGLAPSGWERLRTMLYRAPLYRVTLNAAPQFTVEPELGRDLMLDAAPGADFPVPFALAPRATSLRFEREGTQSSSSGLRVSFYAVRVGRY